MMDVLFLCCAYSEVQKPLFMKASRRGYQFAAQNLQEALIDGFLKNDINLRVLSIPSLSIYPRGCNLFHVKDEVFLYKDKHIGVSVGYFNLPYIRGLCKKKVQEELESWYINSGERKVIFVYALLSFQMSIAINFKKTHPDVKLSIIVPDLPRFMGYNKWLKKLGCQKRDIIKIYDLVKDFDSFVFLAEPMKDDLQVGDKKYTVVEGIYTNDNDNVSVTKDKNKVILYTGNIGRRYGIHLLLDAFGLIKDPNYRLWIRGNGDNTTILEKIRNDNRIRYIGPLSRGELVELQKKATLLVNPVSPDQEFTRFFFPSKTLDYLASGTPTLMFDLECLPKDYHAFIYFFSNTNVDSMAETMRSLCEKDQKELDSFGFKASEFVKQEKNSFKQVAKIKELFDALF